MRYALSVGDALNFVLQFLSEGVELLLEGLSVETFLPGFQDDLLLEDQVGRVTIFTSCGILA